MQADEVLIARGYVRNGLDAARLQGAGQHQGVHAYASQGAAIDVDGSHAAARNDLVHLLEDALERNALRRIDLDGDGKLPRFEPAP